MKASELVALLQEAIATNGDLEIAVTSVFGDPTDGDLAINVEAGEFIVEQKAPPIDLGDGEGLN